MVSFLSFDTVAAIYKKIAIFEQLIESSSAEAS